MTRHEPQPESLALRYPTYIEDAIRALLTDGVEAGATVLQPIAYVPRSITKTRAPTRAQRANVFLRDRFQCRYCGRASVFEWVMALLADIYPSSFPWHMNWKTGSTHPAVALWSPMVDHVNPASHGGDSSLDNLVTACNPCNLAKANFSLAELGWTVLPVADAEWDGLLRYYRPLWEAAGRPRPAVHGGWLRAFGL